MLRNWGIRTRYVVGGALVVGVLATSVAVATQALFTDTASVGTNAFTTGTLDITTSTSSALLTATNWVPGDEKNGTLTVANAGTLALRYSVQDTSNDLDEQGLRDVLVLRIAQQQGGSCDYPYFNTNGTSTTIGDTQLYLSTGFHDLATDIIGNSASGQQTGDRTLGPSTNEVLCFAVAMPLGTTNAQAASTTTVVFTFKSEQTVNNP